MDRVMKISKWLIVAVIAAVVLHYAGRVLILDSFIVSGESMEPVMHSGEKVYVNKMVLGPRIYTDFDFTSPKLHSFRIKGFGKLRPGDVAVFNYPYARNLDTISFRINYVYVKRCIGAPGDSVSIVDGYWHNSRTHGLIGSEREQAVLSETPDSLLVLRGVAVNAFDPDETMGWTIRNFGPCYVPAKGDRIDITDETCRLYRRLILHETGSLPYAGDGCVFLDGKLLESYVFRENYYFFGGDNVLNSRDSRYFGLVPEEYVIGAVAGPGHRKKSTEYRANKFPGLY